QGFTLQSPPVGARRGPLTISLGVAGSLEAHLAHNAQAVDFVGPARRVVLRYAGLSASDARGRALRAWLAAGAGRLTIRVDDRGARYPVRIDPLVQEGSQLVPGDESGAGGFGISVA